MQWLDTPSAEALLFVARRLGPDRVGIVVGARTEVEDALDLRGLEEIKLEGLDAEASRALLRSRYPRDALPDEVAERLRVLTGGTPLALVEVPSLLSPARLRGEEQLPDPLPVGDAIRRAFRHEIDALPRGTVERAPAPRRRRPRVHGGTVAGAAKAGIDPAAMEPAERAHLFRVEGDTAAFRHPLLRSAVYDRATPAERRAAHRALAEACAGIDPERHTWHLAAATVEPDERVAAALEASAQASRSRAAYASAARALERAAQLSPDIDRRAGRLLDAAENSWRAGDSVRALRLLEDARAVAQDPALLADVLLLHGRFAYAHGSATQAYGLLQRGVDAVEPFAPDKAAELLMQAAWVCFGAADLPRSLDAADRAIEIADRVGGAVELSALVVKAEALVLHGRAREARRLLARWKASADAETYALTMRFNPTTALVYLDVEDYQFARRLIETFHVAARSAPELLPLVLGCLTQFEYRTGDWTDAYAHGSEGMELGAAVGQESAVGFVIANLAIVEAGMGRAEARAHARQVDELATQTGFHSLRAYVRSAVGLLDLGAGRIEPAIRELEEVDRMMRGWGVEDPSVVQWMPDLIEAYVRAARRDEAEVVLKRLSAQAERTDGSWARAAAARCTGLMAEAYRRALRDRARHPCRHADAVRARADAAVLRRAAAAVRSTRGGPYAVAPRTRCVRAPGRSGLAEASGDGTRRDGRTAGVARQRHRSDVAAGVAGRASGRGRRDESGSGGRAVRDDQDGRVPPAQRLPEARHPVANGAGAGSGRSAGRRGGRHRLAVSGASRARIASKNSGFSRRDECVVTLRLAALIRAVRRVSCSASVAPCRPSWPR